MSRERDRFSCSFSINVVIEFKNEKTGKTKKTEKTYKGNLESDTEAGLEIAKTRAEEGAKSNSTWRGHPLTMTFGQVVYTPAAKVETTADESVA